MKYIKILAAVLALAPASCAGAIPEKMECRGFYKRHLQGIEAHGGKMYWSHADMLVRTDMNGNIETLARVPYHHGDICIADGKLYSGVNCAKFNVPGESDDWVFVYDLDLKFIEKHKIDSIDVGVGGIACHGGKFLIFGGANKKTRVLPIAVYSKDFKLERVVKLPYDESPDGIQTIKYAYGKYWLSTYPMKPATCGMILLDDDFNIVGRLPARYPYGMAATNRKNGEFLVGALARDPDKTKEGRCTAWAELKQLGEKQ